MKICHISLLFLDFIISVLTASSGFYKKIPKFEAERFWRYIAAQNASLHLEFQQSNFTDAVLFAAYGGRTNHNLLLAIESSTKLDQVAVKVRYRSQTSRSYVSNVSLDRNNWNQIILTFRGSIMELFLNCTSILQISNVDPDFQRNHIRLSLGQNTHKPKQLHGMIRQFNIESSEQYHRYCSAHDFRSNEDDGEDGVSFTQQTTTLLPFRPNENQKSENESRNTNLMLEQILKRVSDVEANVSKWLATIHSYDQRLRRIELHQRGCQIDNQLIAVGQKYRNDTQCTECVCTPDGEINCERIGCVPLECEHPVLQPGKCCPVCAKECFYNGRRWQNGQQYWPKKCVRCICDDGNMGCQFLESNMCPKLVCEEQEIPPNQCCPVCVNTDFCGQANPCDPNADCENNNYGAKCRCKTGYFGNGTICHDIDECIWDDIAREQLGGCLSGTMCVNLPGSFKCECLPGYQRLDDRNCMDILRI